MQKFSSTGTFLTKWGSRGIGDGQFSNPRGVAVDSSGNVYVSEFDNNRIQKFSSTGTFLAKRCSRRSVLRLGRHCLFVGI
ncbi:MAG: SBBP repeat-containing protein [Methanoregula sp.]|nr:SBBP repeat-containing protein [Methanoregula sp.]